MAGNSHGEKFICRVTHMEGKDTGTKDTISQFERRNKMSSSNILGIHGLKKKPQFQGSNRDIQWWLCTSVIMYVVYSIIRRSSDWTVLDVWTACKGGGYFQ